MVKNLLVHNHFCPFCEREWACQDVGCIDEAGEELFCPSCEHDIQDEDEGH